MDQRGYSLCGGGPSFPVVAGPGRWENPRTFVLPVRLRPAAAYSFSLNCAASRGFKNLAGESLSSIPLSFQTRAAVSDQTTEVRNAAAVAALRRAIDQHYSYRDRLIHDWDVIWNRADGALKLGSDPISWATQAGALLAGAKDGHLFFEVGDVAVPTFRPDLRPNADASRLPGAVPGWKLLSPTLAVGRFPDGIGYLMIASWQGDDASFRVLFGALDELTSSGAAGLILDVRFNSGGDERHAQAVAARFVTDDHVFARHRSRDPLAPGGWSPVQSRRIAPATDPAKRFQGRVAVLMGPMCFSSNESFLLMMRHGARARLFGDRSFGSSGNPQPYDLGNGVVAMIPSWEAQDADGSVIEGVGIAPDEKAEPGSNPTQDDVLGAGLHWLHSK